MLTSPHISIVAIQGTIDNFMCLLMTYTYTLSPRGNPEPSLLISPALHLPPPKSRIQVQLQHISNIRLLLTSSRLVQIPQSVDRKCNRSPAHLIIRPGLAYASLLPSSPAPHAILLVLALPCLAIQLELPRRRTADRRASHRYASKRYSRSYSFLPYISLSSVPQRVHVHHFSK